MCLLNSSTIKCPTLNSSIYSFDLDNRCNFLLQYIHQCNTDIRSRWLAPFYVVDVGCASSAEWNCACRLRFVYHVQHRNQEHCFECFTLLDSNFSVSLWAPIWIHERFCRTQRFVVQHLLNAFCSVSVGPYYFLLIMLRDFISSKKIYGFIFNIIIVLLFIVISRILWYLTN